MRAEMTRGPSGSLVRWNMRRGCYATGKKLPGPVQPGPAVGWLAAALYGRDGFDYLGRIDWIAAWPK
jgi:hypothetical protein